MALDPRIARLVGPGLVAAAAALWATDALFRFPAVQEIPPTWIVFLEHVVILAVLAPAMILQRKRLFDLRPLEWLAALVVGAGGSAVATVFFTLSFRYVNPSVSILLQKLQPVLTVLLAMAFLGEWPRKAFYPWAGLALAAGIVVSFPDFNFSFLGGEGGSLRSHGALLALSAAALWSFSTVAGKALLRRVTPSIASFWRFFFGLVTLAALLLVERPPLALAKLADPAVIKPILYMGLVPGLAAVYLYYLGLRRTRASIATFVELLFPVSAVILNTVFLNLSLEPVQIGAGAVLLVAVTLVSIKGQEEPPGGERTAPARPITGS